ncbi:phosphomannomutase/phosphoglucomutase [Actinospica robiniae]|uniref:phosphomannomutase/phosphoglucomutase n=1 Tax=Actinospica robiniae TaxID=304901 RepID=UPI00040BDBC3|nr:phosphomannomutase/phosphoglucomutase [Actinospica robiniae]
MQDLSKVIKAYDVRGVVPDELDDAIVGAVGAAFARLAQNDIVVVRDMRTSSPQFLAAFAEGVTSQGYDVIDAGLGSTDLAYFASGKLDLPGAMITASHNPAKYNGLKLCWPGAKPVGQDTGLGQIRQLIEEGIPVHDGARGSIIARPMADDYAAYLNSLVNLTGIRRLKVVADAGNGMGGHMAPIVFAGLPIDLTPMYFELDGSFPNHEANPLDPKNLIDLQAKVRESGADIGLAFDGDADRCFVVDENGEPVPPSAIVALIATRELAKAPGSTIVYNVITSRAVPEIVAENGGQSARTRVGHVFMKSLMAETDAVFGGEHSGHYYFRDFWRADTGMLAALHVLAALGESDLPMSKLVAQYSRYTASGEINTEVAGVAATLAKVEEHFAGREDVELDRMDGLTVVLATGWFNLRPSNTEPLLRLNVEADNETAMADLRDEVLALVR